MSRGARRSPTSSRIAPTTSGSSATAARGRGAPVARSVAATASSRTAPSSIHVSTVRSAILLASTDGSRGVRGPRRAATSAARRSASVRGRRGAARLAGGRAPGRGADRPPGRPSARPAGRPPGRPAGRPLVRPARCPCPPPDRGGRPPPAGRPRDDDDRGSEDDMGAHPTGGPARFRAGERRRAPPQCGGALLVRNVLLSQGISPQVPSALTGLTSVFGMGTGVTLSLWPPKSVVNVCRTRGLQSKHERSIQALGRLVPVG